MPAHHLGNAVTEAELETHVESPSMELESHALCGPGTLTSLGEGHLPFDCVQEDARVTPCSREAINKSRLKSFKGVS